MRVKGYALEVLEDLFQPMLEGGSFFLYLREFVDYFLASSTGMIMQNFVLSIQEFLTFYQNYCNNLLSQVNARRFQESTLLKLDLIDRDITVIELSVHMGPLIKQIKMLAAVSLHQRFKTPSS